MLPPNLLIVSMVVFLVTTVSTAPVEETEREEAEVEVEGELSEEEEDDDDSKSQDKSEGPLGVQQTTAAVAVAAAAARGSGVSVRPGVSSELQHISVSSIQSAVGGGANDGTAGHRGHSSSSVDSAGSASSAGSPAEAREPIIAQTHSAGSDGVDPNGNSQKLLNGGGGADSQTGVLGSFGGGDSQLLYTGTIDPSAHFLLGLMGRADPFGPDAHISVPGLTSGHTGPPTLDSGVMSSGVTAAPAADQNSGSSLDSPAGPAPHSDMSVQSGGELTSLSSRPDQSPSSFDSGSSHSITQGASSSSSLSSYSDAHREETGNGRQTLLTESHRAVTAQVGSFSVLQTQNVPSDLTAGGMMMSAGGAESVTSFHNDLTASGLGIGHDVTISGAYSHTDLVTMATDTTGTDAFSADPTGLTLDSSHTAVIDHTQMAGSATEQYNPSGQGPEGAENVELEDTC